MGDPLYINYRPVGNWFRYQFLEKTEYGFGYLFAGFISSSLAMASPWGTLTASPFSHCFWLFVINDRSFQRPLFLDFILDPFSSVTITVDRLVELPLPSGTLLKFYLPAFVEPDVEIRDKKKQNLILD
jgi:hypothetical protein